MLNPLGGRDCHQGKKRKKRNQRRRERQINRSLRIEQVEGRRMLAALIGNLNADAGHGALSSVLQTAGQSTGRAGLNRAIAKQLSPAPALVDPLLTQLTGQALLTAEENAVGPAVTIDMPAGELQAEWGMGNDEMASRLSEVFQLAGVELEAAHEVGC